ncbi:TPA: DUF1542 domain-containing protein [Streptococcus suis]
MSYKDMFRKEQRFSFRKFSFGLASAVIANVILGGAIANSPVVHANTVTEAEAAVAPANQDLGNETKTEEEPKEPIEAVRADVENRAAEILPEALNASVTNLPAAIPTIGSNAGLPAKNNDAKQFEVLHVFGNVSGTTETESTKGTGAPDFDPSNATVSFPITDPENDAVTIKYKVPANFQNYIAGNPQATVKNNNETAETKNLGRENTNELLLNEQGRLVGVFPYNPGGLFSRIIELTDAVGNVSYSNPFYVIAYTDKRADNADLIVGQESDLTATNIFSKLKIDTTSGYPTTNPSLTVPETEYTRTIVGYRLTGTNDVQNLSADTLNTLPAGGNYEIKVKTTNQYGQTIYNWVPVNDTRTKEVSKEDLFVFNNSPIQTVDGTNKVKVVTVEDKDGVQAIDYYQTPNNQRSDLKGVTITPEAVTSTNKVEGYVTGTPVVDAIGYYTRSFGVTDAKGNLVITYPNVSGGEDKRQVIHVMDTNVTGPVTKQAGEIPTKNEILAKVTVNYGTPHKKITNPTSMYSMDLAPDQKVPTEPGEYDVKVRVVTASNVYKDVTVKVIIPKYSDVLTAKAEENTSLVPGSGAAATQPITLTKEEVVDGQKTNVATTAPAGTAYAVEQKFLSEKQALGYEISVSETGEVSVKAPAGQEVDITVPVTVAYPDNSTDIVNVLFKVNQKDLAQIEAKKAIDDKLAEVIKELEAKRDVAIAEIDNNISLREEQKQAAKAAVTAVAGDALKDLDNKAAEAKEKIDKATTVSKIDEAKVDGESALINAEDAGEKAIDRAKDKAEAIAVVENKAFEALEKVNNNPNLSDDDKQAHFDDINATKETAIEEINNAGNTEEITAAIDKAEIAYNEDVINAAQLDALNKLEKDSEETKAAIDANPNLTPEEKAKAIAKVDELVNNAESDILSKPTPETVQAVEDKADKDLAKVELQAAADDAKKGIEANPNLTPEEKESAKKAVEDAVKVATDAIDKASTPTEVDTATSDGVKAIDAEEFKATQKDAKNKIAKEAESAKKAIDDNQNLTPDEKESAKNAVKEAAKVATDAIDKASTPNAVQAEEHKGVAAINLITAKADAKGAVAAKLADEIKKLKDKQAEAEKAIDASTMTNEEKAIAKKALQDVVDKGKAELEDAARVATNEIHKATTAEDAKAAALAGEKSLTDAGKKARDAVELAKDKELAKEAIRTEEEEATKAVEKLAEDTRKAIEENPNLSDEDKQAEIKKLTAAVAKTLETIRDNATTAMQEAEKAQALADLEKAKETQKIADKAAIDELTSLVKDGELEAMKQDAKNKIVKDAAAAKEAIASNPNLTDAEKKTFTDAVDAEVAKANDAISAATSPADVQKEEDAGVAAIAEDVLDAAKQDAKNKIAKDAAAAKEAIASNPNLSDEAKEAAKKAVDTDAQVATDAIDKALKPDAVQAEEDKGVGAIAKDVLDAAKQDAKNKIAKESGAAKSAIDTNPNLTTQEKESAKNAVEEAAKVATDAIDKASTPGAVQVEEDKGVVAINLITAKADAKGAIAAKLADEIKKLEDKQAEAEKAIDASTMTNEEKAIAKKALQDVVDKGKAELEDAARVATNEIHKATTAEDAKAAALAGEKSLTDAGKKARDAVELAKDKELAKEAIRTEEEEATKAVEKLAEDTLKAIKEDPNLSDEDKQAEIKKLTDVVTKTLETIHDNATKATQEAEKTQALADLEKAKETQKIADKAAIDELNLLVKDGELEVTKRDAKNKIAKEAESAKSAIDSNPNLTDAEKESAKKAVDTAAQAATDAIAKASTPDAVQAEEDKGVSAIATDVLDAAKQDAKNKIAKEAESAKSAIDSNPNLTDAEKESAKKAVDADAKAATDAIDASTSPVEAQSAEDKGVGSIAQDVLDAAKQDAKNKIAKDVADAKEAIATNPNLTDAEKEAAKKAVDADAQAATDAIAKASTPDAVQSEEDKGVGAIAQDVLDAAKQDAKNKIAKEAESAKSAIDTNPNLTDAEKESAKKAVDADVQAATEAIDASTSPVEAQSAEDKGVGSIAQDVLDAAKQDAKNKIAKEVDAAKSAIDSNPNLSDAEKESAKKAVDADAQAATEVIDASTSPSDAQSAEDKGVSAIAKDVLDAAKQDAKNKIAKEAESAKSAIDAKPNLSDAEKESAKKAVDADAQAATAAIAKASMSDAVQSEEDKGVGAIAKDVLDAAKQDAKNKIGKEAESAKSAIDSNPNLTDAAKEAAKSEIDKAVDEVIALINGVRTHQELEKIKLPMAALIKPAAKVTPVVDPNNLTEKEIARIKAFLKENNNLPEGTEINVSKDASVTIKYPDGTIDLLSPVEVVKQADKTAPTVANDGKGNIVIVPSEKAVEIVVSYVDNNGKPQTVVVTKGTDGLWTASNTVVIVDPVTGQVIVPGSVIKPGTVVTAYSKDEVGNSSDSAEAEVVAVDENNSAAGVKVKSVTTNANNVEKKAKQLPNTGEEASSATSLGLVALGLGLALLAAKRRRDEEA